jgi:hypothetical protein
MKAEGTALGVCLRLPGNLRQREQAMAPKIKLEAAALATTTPVLPHQRAAWNWLQDLLTEPQIVEFAEIFRADPPEKEPLVPVLATDSKGSPTWPPGMVGPKIRPTMKPGDHHLIANDVNETLTAWTHDGRQLWRIPCLCRGQGKEAEWGRTGEDTPPGLYRINPQGIHRDYEQDPTATFTPDRRAYGWYSFDLEGPEEQEGPTSRPYRDGIMVHGGGTACGWPGAWNFRQGLHPTLGCIRLHNQDLRDRILPMLDLGTVWISVLQEAA